MTRKKKVMSLEEMEDRRLNFRLEQLKEYKYLPEPSYYFNIGDKVSIGMLKECTIEEIYHNAKIYKVKYISYSREGVPSEQHELFNWMDIRPIATNKESFIRNKDIRLNNRNTTIDGLLNKVFHFGVDFEPNYQRDFVWDDKDRELLLDSIFNCVDIGRFVFISNECPVNDEILDGKQRLKTIVDFYLNRIEYKGKYFNDLCEKDQNHFIDYTVTYCETSNLTEKDKLRYFVMFNSTGKTMDIKHLEDVKKKLEEY